jgi:MFS family permease
MIALQSDARYRPRLPGYSVGDVVAGGYENLESRRSAGDGDFVFVIDTSLMNVSISAVVRDLDTTVSGVQSAVALETLVSAAFILIGSKLGDLFGRKRAYVVGLVLYASGAPAMVFAQGLAAIIVFWAIIGGLGASLYLPAMQSLIHGNFEGKARAKVFPLIGASAAIAAAIGPLLGGIPDHASLMACWLQMEANGVTLRLARAKPQVLAVLEADGINDRIGADHIHGNVHLAVEAQLADADR